VKKIWVPAGYYANGKSKPARRATVIAEEGPYYRFFYDDDGEVDRIPKYGVLREGQ
jgi:hypothetical protein